MAYYISMKRYFNNRSATLIVDLLGANTSDGVASFATRADAASEIERFNSTVYCQSHKEVGRPALRIKTPSQLTAHQRAQIAA
jgi:hypothetical protein